VLSSKAFVCGTDQVEVQLDRGLGWSLGNDIESIHHNDEIVVSGILDIVKISRDAQQLGDMIALGIEVAFRFPAKEGRGRIPIQQC
jgi:hypothetical protein